MMLIFFALFGVLAGPILAQHPDNWSHNSGSPTTIPALDCSVRDSKTSALASCTKSHDTLATNYPEECRSLLMEQGLFSSCITATKPKPFSKPTYTLMDGTTQATFTSNRIVTQFNVAPPDMKVADIPAPTNSIALLDDLTHPTDPVYDSGYPLPYCPDVDHCPVKFRWRNAPWEAPHGICTLCKDLENVGWVGLPYNTFPYHMQMYLCKKWQPPAAYDC
ncbi:uncharacterized protein HMPREF1541_08254 [Cyphellophora europaea CBS 101466]|uniref:Uncharacterized protein n=1 Tax=Cyphellophora europaea (strain CBS 101466) TaxID=1220924 RepID=W2RNI3_CYPE1|nr:uncharacterized protein HMPREF1541_08254 [Cyphellophora europaea CBS 101466]ETN37263.1 hypothetical protein HMPREF1541_08254 [Cyphellophora europaea CBS 101466]